MPRLDDHVCSRSGAEGVRRRGHPQARAGGLAAKAGEMIRPSAPGPSLVAAPSARDAEPPGRPRGGSWHHHLLRRSLVLFSVGVFLALVLNLLQVQRNVTLFPEEVLATTFSSAWWVPPCCGTAAGEWNRGVSVWSSAASDDATRLFGSGGSARRSRRPPCGCWGGGAAGRARTPSAGPRAWTRLGAGRGGGRAGCRPRAGRTGSVPSAGHRGH